MKRPPALAHMLFLAAWLLAGCGLPGLGAAPTPTITFGATISITGRTAQEGEYARDGYQFFVDAVNARGGIAVDGTTYKLRFRYYDDESNPERTAALYERLITEDKVNFLLGPYGSAPTAAAAPLAAKYRLPLVSGHGSASNIYDVGNGYLWGIQTPAANYLRGVIAAIRDRDPSVKTLAMLSEDDPFSSDVASGAIAYAREQGLDVLYHGTYASDTRDVSALVSTAQAHHPDIVLGAGHLQDSILIVKQARQLGLAPKAMGFSVGPSSPQFRENLRGDADYIFGATQWTEDLRYTGSGPWPTPRAFAEAFTAAYPHYKTVPYQVAESVAALLVFEAALEQAQTIDPERLRATLAALKLDTFFGPIAFDERGVNSAKPMAVEQLQPDGQKYTVFPRDVAERDALYPMPPWSER